MRSMAELTPEGSTPPTEAEILRRVLATRLGYYRGLSHGVQPIPSRSTSQTIHDERVRESNTRTVIALEEVEKLRSAMAAQAEDHQQQIAELRALIESMRDQIGSSS